MLIFFGAGRRWCPDILTYKTKLPMRDLAPVLVGRDLPARSAELVSLNAEDVEFGTDGAVVKLRRTKTSP